MKQTENAQKNAPSTLKSMASLAFYLVLVMAVWAIIAHVVFPNGNNTFSYADFVSSNEPLLTQAAENVLDPETWPGVQSTKEIRALYEKAKITETRSADGQAQFILSAENLSKDLTTYLAYCPDGEFLLAEGTWTVTANEGKSTRYENETAPGSYITVQQLTEHFYLAESHIPE